MGEAAALAFGGGAFCAITADELRRMATAARRGRRRRELWLLRMRIIGVRSCLQMLCEPFSHEI
jgi:hypothetical protein